MLNILKRFFSNLAVDLRYAMHDISGGIMMPQKFSLAFGATTPHIAQVTVNECGKFNSMLVVTPNFTNAVTTTIQILDEDGNTIFNITNELNRGQAISAQARNTTTFYQFDYPYPVYRNWKVQATISGDAGAGGGTVICKIYIEADKH